MRCVYEHVHAGKDQPTHPCGGEVVAECVQLLVEGDGVCVVQYHTHQRQQCREHTPVLNDIPRSAAKVDEMAFRKVTLRTIIVKQDRLLVSGYLILVQDRKVRFPGYP